MKSKQILSLSLAACLTIGSLAGAGEAQAKAKAKKPVLSKTKMTAYIGKTKTLKVKKNGTKKIVKTKWTLSGKKVAKLSKKKKTSVTIKGLKKGSATVKAKVWYQKKGAKKKKKVTLKCKVSVTKYVSPEAKKKANVLNATTKYQPLAKLAAQHGFKLGTVVNYTNVTTNDNYKNLVKYHFNSLTAGNEFKAYSLLDQAKSAKSKDGMPVMNYDKADTIISFAKENGIQMRGHVLVWHAYMCDWFFREGYDTSKKYVSKAVMQKRLQYYIKEVITHFEKKYPGVIYCWDVVNEAVNDDGTMRTSSNWYKVYGDAGYVTDAFTFARKYADKDVKLFLNDYNEYAAAKRDRIYQVVKDLYDKGLCDGVGMQSHYSMTSPTIAAVKVAIQKYNQIDPGKIEIQLTELDIHNTFRTAADQKSVATKYQSLFNMLVDSRRNQKINITGVTFWGLTDGDSWLSDFKGETSYPLLFGADYAAKSAYFAVLNAAK